MPSPEWMSNPGVIMSTAVERRHCFTWAGVARGFDWSISAATPDTWGDAIDVPAGAVGGATAGEVHHLLPFGAPRGVNGLAGRAHDDGSVRSVVVATDRARLGAVVAGREHDVHAGVHDRLDHPRHRVEVS